MLNVTVELPSEVAETAVKPVASSEVEVARAPAASVWKPVT